MPGSIRFHIDLAGKAHRCPTILVVSEDQDWRAVLRRVLEQEGYEVLTARHAGHALVTSVRHDGGIDLLITDGVQGRRRTDLAPRMFRDNPGMRLLHLTSRPRTREDLVERLRQA